MWIRSAACLLAVLSPGLSFAATPAAGDLELGPVYAEGLPRVEVTVEAWPGSSAEDAAPPEPGELTLVEDGRPTARALSVQPFGDRGIAVVVAVDVSGTMAGAPLEATRRALSSLLDDVGPRDRFALLTFADEARLEVGFDDPPEVARRAVAGLAPRGRLTRIHRALLAALDAFDAAGGGLPERRRLIVLSDGKPEGDPYTAADVVDAARRRRTPVDAIGLTRIGDGDLLHLERLSSLTGGHYARAASADDVAALFGRGMERLASTPVAIFDAETWQADGQPHRLGVLWQRDGRVLSGETLVALPAAESPPPGEGSDPGATPAPEADEAPRGEAGDRLPWLVALAVAVLLLAIALVAFARRRRRSTAGERDAAPPAAPRPAAPAGEPRRGEAHAPPSHREDDDGTLTLAEAAPAGGAAAGTAVPPPEARKTQFRTVFGEPRAGAPSAFLVAEGDGGRSVPIDRSPLWIGAAESADLRVDDRFASSRHASIRFQDGSLLVDDNASTNGTFVNGERLTGPRPLAPGDRLRVGRSTFELRPVSTPEGAR